MSYKDFYAQAHCAAAYLMEHGLNHGDSVVILSGNTAEYLILDQALQYLGAINITLPPTVSPEALLRICDRYEARFLFVPDAATMHAHGQFSSLKPQLAAIVVGTDDLEGLETQKLIAFDRLVAIGKTAWREQAQSLKDRKRRVRPSDLYALIFPDEGENGDFEPLSFMALLENVENAQKLYSGQPETAAASFLPPYRILHRTHAVYGSMMAQTPIWICLPEHLEQPFFSAVKPEVMFVAPPELTQVYTLLPSLMTKEGASVQTAASAIGKAHEVLEKKANAESQGKKNPILNSLKYRFGNQKTYRKIKLALGGKLVRIACDHGKMDGMATLLLQECGIQIEQPKPFY